MESLKDTWNYKIKPLIDECFSLPGIMSDEDQKKIREIDEKLNSDHHVRT